MALLVRVLKNQTSITQWVPVCSRLVPVSPPQGQWQSGTSQWPQMSQSLALVGSEKMAGVDIQLSRKYHTTNKKIKIAALRMYTSCVEKTDFEEFFLRCQIPDTFNSWFLITLLHVWMCLVRMKQEGRSGKYMCRIIVHFMWEDVEQRGKVMGVNPYILKKNMVLMTNSFYAAILGYDEGILSDDHGLAAALWRTFFNQKCEDPRHLALLVEYVRKQIQYLDSMNGEDLLLTGEVSWRPLVEKNPQSVLKAHAPTYNDEGL
ncbi:ubiquinol-cytochrome c reductase complex assembly factor 1 isoform X2 [Tenrec ecaudatus]|uniref:ubiquinol-cytochrome c reductase complex assembly factor 1 isoform X2 n=1 Tax=Tenrec ecaudatus TaxID=94439 RepID=UPI003F5AD437